MQAPNRLVASLVELETIKIWSLIVTLFGDMAGDELTGTQIRALLGHIGIKPEAIRVALHRLKSDGWITADKRGREAVYRLSAKGRRETDAVIEDVYRQNVKFPEGWRFLLVKDVSAPAGSITITRELVLVPAALAAHVENGLVLESHGRDLPNWIEECLVPRPLLRIAEALTTILVSASPTGPDVAKPDEIALRLLVLHHWRRLALRPGSWAHIGLLPDGVLANCHAVVTAFLEKGKRLSL